GGAAMSEPVPRLLVVTPTLGASPWLDETVASVTKLPLHVTHILAAPAARHAALTARFPQAEIVRDAGKPGGIYGALNAALLHANDDWDWFTYINDDDALLPGCGAMFWHHHHAASGEAVIYGDVELVDEGGRALSRVTTERDPAWIPALLQQGIS